METQQDTANLKQLPIMSHILCERMYKRLAATDRDAADANRLTDSVHTRHDDNPNNRSPTAFADASHNTATKKLEKAPNSCIQQASNNTHTNSNNTETQQSNKEHTRGGMLCKSSATGNGTCIRLIRSECTRSEHAPHSDAEHWRQNSVDGSVLHSPA